MEQAVTVLHIGAALPETVDFFADYRCKLYFVDVFSGLPINTTDDTAPDAALQFRQLLDLPAHSQVDICLFWDLFNYLDSAALKDFLAALRPHLKDTTLAHAFSVHNRKVTPQTYLYGIHQMDTLSLRSRRTPATGYAPHSQRELTELLDCFRLERSVLLPDSRLELLLHRR